MHSRRLFCAFCILIGIQLILTSLNFQITPFYVWSMYGAKIPVQSEYPVYVLSCDRDTFNFPTWMDHRKMFFTYTILRYDQYLENKMSDPFEEKSKHKFSKLNLPDNFYTRLYNTPSEINSYPKWLKHYMAANLEVKINSLEVNKIWVHYTNTGRLSVDSDHLLINE